jgi:hypothetical protein
VATKENALPAMGLDMNTEILKSAAHAVAALGKYPHGNLFTTQQKRRPSLPSHFLVLVKFM